MQLPREFQRSRALLIEVGVVDKMLSDLKMITSL
jgi:acetyl-CoA carboxylase beta subunit